MGKITVWSKQHENGWSKTDRTTRTSQLMRYHEELLHGNTELVRNVQAGLWRIKKEWIR